MSVFHVFCNPKSGNDRGEAQAHRLDTIWTQHTMKYYDITRIPDVKGYIGSIPEDEGIVICGGDGTLNHFVNDMNAEDPGRDIYFFGCGSGNDFLKDIGRSADDEPILLNPYMVDLPSVTVNGMTRYYLNGIGFGIDGYCCEIGDRIRDTSQKKVNYTLIAVKGLMYDFHRVKASVTVDGVTTTHTKVWLAPCMKGRFFGGGMMCAPLQNRLADDHSVTVMVMRCSSKLKTLFVFPSIFKGKHIRHTEMVTIRPGHDVHVVFDHPTALQIDGETVLNVTEYTVSTRHGTSAKHPQTAQAAASV